MGKECRQWRLKDLRIDEVSVAVVFVREGVAGAADDVGLDVTTFAGCYGGRPCGGIVQLSFRTYA